jgi:hypothetical protein
VRESLAHGFLIALMVKASSSSETSVNFIRLHGATTQKAAIFILAALSTSNHSVFTAVI